MKYRKANLSMAARAVAFALLAVCLPPASRADAPPLAAVIGEAKAEVTAVEQLTLTEGQEVDVPPSVARFPLRWRPDVDPKVIEADLVDVRHGDRRDRLLASQFKARLEDEEGVFVLLIEIERKPPVEQGTYSLVVDLIGPATTELPHGERVELKLEVVLPAAEIETAAAITLTRIVGLRSTEVVIPDLRLTESSGQSFLSRLSAPDQATLLDESSQSTSGRLTVGMPAALPALGTAPYTLALDGEPPLGKTSAALRIRAPELSEPVDLAVTVVSRRSGSILVVVIFAGVLAGFIFRKVLAVIEQRSRARLQAAEMLAKLEKEEAADGDTAFLDGVRRLRATLTQAAAGPPAPVPAAITAAQTALTALITELDGRLQTARQERAELAAALAGAPADLPEALADLIAGAKADLQRTADRMTRAGFAAASAEHRRIEQKTADALRAPVRDLATGAEAAVLRLRALNSSLAAQELEAVSEPLSGVLATAAELAGSADSLGLAQLLEKTEELLEGGARLASRLSLGILYTLHEALAILEGLPTTDETRVLRDAERDFQTAVHAASSSGEVIEAVVARHRRLDRALRAAILAQVPAGERSDVEAKLDQGGFSAELRKLQPDDVPARSLKIQLTADASSMSAGEEEALDLLEIVRGLWRGRGRRRQAPAVVGGAATPLPSFPAVDPVLELWKLLAVRILQSAFALLVIVAAGYFLFEGDWTGTPRQMLGIIAWAFGLDLGLDKAMEIAAPVHKPAS